MRGRLSEFAEGTGKQVLVDASMVSRRDGMVRQFHIHTDPDCPRVRAQPMVFPTERAARAVIQDNVKPCRHCRPEH